MTRKYIGTAAEILAWKSGVGVVSFLRLHLAWTTLLLTGLGNTTGGLFTLAASTACLQRFEFNLPPTPTL